MLGYRRARAQLFKKPLFPKAVITFPQAMYEVLVSPHPCQLGIINPFDFSHSTR